MTGRTGRTEMHLHDGRVLDLSNLTIDEILLRLLRERIEPEMVRETRHILDFRVEELPRPAEDAGSR